MTKLLQDNLWHIPEMKKVIEGAGYSAESLMAREMNKGRGVLIFTKRSHLEVSPARFHAQLNLSDWC
jgi:hypothetical protein